MKTGHYWVKWSHSKLDEVFVVYVCVLGECWVSGCDTPYDLESFVFMQECVYDGI
jgi:hypothetical protein